MKKKIFSILFALVLVISFSLVMAVPAAATPEATLTIGDIAVAPGGTVTVPIMANDVEGSYEVCQAGIDLQYDPSVVIVTDVTSGTGPPVWSWSSPSPGRVTTYQMSFMNVYEGDFVIANVTFQAIGSAGEDCALHFGDGNFLANYSGVDVSPLTLVDGTFTIVAALLPMSQFEIDKASIDFGNPGDDKVRLKGTLELDLDNGDGVDISEDVTVTVGTFSDTIAGGAMVEKGKNDEKWEYNRLNGDGSIEKMTIKWKTGNDGSEWKIGKFDISMDKADLTDITNPVTISLQLGDDFGEDNVVMRVRWDYKAP